MDSDWSITTLDGREDVCLVRVDLRNDGPVDRRVEVRNRLDGPVLPPRRGGVPEPGWSRAGFEGVVPASDRLVLGYACPAPAERPPVSVIEGGRATDAEGAIDAERAVRELADPRPPADAVPSAAEPPDGSSPTDDERDTATPTDGDATALPPPVGSWLSDVERRVERGERLADGSLAEVTAALDATDEAGEDVTALDGRLARDAATLREVAARAESLSERATAVDLPLDALRRLA
jgi:hypothetical protein